MWEIVGVKGACSKGRCMCLTYSWGPIFGVGCEMSLEAGSESESL